MWRTERRSESLGSLVSWVGVLILAGLVACSGEPQGEAETETAGAGLAPLEEHAPVSTADPAAVASLELPNAKEPTPGVLTGGQPTPELLAAAANAGYRTVVTLRPEGEVDWDEAAQVEALGMRFVSVPISGVADLGAESAGALATLLDDPASKPMIVHCGSGNRVGGLFAMKAFHLDGLGVEEALEVGRNAGLTRLEPAVREALETAVH